MSISCSQIATVQMNEDLEPQVVRLIDTTVDEKGITKFSFEASVEGDWSVKFELSELFIDKSFVDKSTTHSKRDYLGGRFTMTDDYKTEDSEPQNAPVTGSLRMRYDSEKDVLLAKPLGVCIGGFPIPSSQPSWTLTLKVPEAEET